MYNLKKYILVLLLLFNIDFLNANEHDLKVRHILDSSGVAIDYKLLNSGKTMVVAREDQENTDSSIALSMALYLKAPYKNVLSAIQKGDGRLSGYKNAKRIYIKDIKNAKTYFDDIDLAKDEMDEVKKLFNYDEDTTFNLSKQEIKKLKSLRKKSSHNKREIASLFFKDILHERFEAYLKKGIDGISAYEHCASDDTVKDGFKKSSLGMNVFKKDFSDMYKVYMHYPKDKSTDIKERFFIIKDKIDDRIAFILKHQMIKEKENLVFIAERQFYISNSLDAIQIQILCTPYKDGTLVALSSQSYTDKVAGFSRRIAVKVGRSMMEKQIRPIFDTLEKEFNR